MSDTPRTDDQIGHGGSTMTFVRICFTRQLERELNAAKAVLTQIYNDTEGYADGAPDASAHDKLCNEISSKLKPFIT